MSKPSLQQRTAAQVPGQLGWDDLRTVLAIARHGSLSGAARALTVRHSTVYRRLAALERQLGVRLFERDRSGYLLNAHGEAVSEAARAMEAAALGAERRVLGADARPSGTIRIATSELLAAYLLPRLLPRFLKEYPEIEIEVDVSNANVDLTRRDADVALRATLQPPDELVGRKLATLHYALYASPRLLKTRRSPPPLASLPWIGFDDRMRRYRIARWLEETMPEIRPQLRVESLGAMLRMAAEGVGAVAFPMFAADQEPRVLRLSAPMVQPTMDLWLLHHPDLRANARVRALAGYLANAVPPELARIARDGHRCERLAVCPQQKPAPRRAAT